MSATEKIDMKERILATADRLFYLQGIRAIGVDTIAAEIGISKRTLYNHFPSKDALISARGLRPSSLCWSTAQSRRTWCATIRRWRGRRSRPRGCF